MIGMVTGVCGDVKNIPTGPYEEVGGGYAPLNFLGDF